jgi:hypothetical protein
MTPSGDLDVGSGSCDATGELTGLLHRSGRRRPAPCSVAPRRASAWDAPRTSKEPVCRSGGQDERGRTAGVSRAVADLTVSSHGLAARAAPGALRPGTGTGSGSGHPAGRRPRCSVVADRSAASPLAPVGAPIHDVALSSRRRHRARRHDGAPVGSNVFRPGGGRIRPGSPGRRARPEGRPRTPRQPG